LQRRRIFFKRGQHQDPQPDGRQRVNGLTERRGRRSHHKLLSKTDRQALECFSIPMGTD